MRNRKQNREPEHKGLYVTVINNDVTKAMRRFKKKVAEDGLLQELRKREYFESRGTKKRLAKKAAERRFKRNMEKRKEQLGY
tara:strand:- start:588 stop:833 length:246 start_codon:yes stop_codon:yes gene_type:complete